MAKQIDDMDGVDALRNMVRDAKRYRALRANTGHEYDLSTGPGIPKVLIIRVNCEGCEKWTESGAPDYEGTLDAALDDEIRLQDGSTNVTGEAG